MTVKQFTWQEVAKHNSRSSALVIIHGKVYDVTSWMSRHPGGSNVLLLAAGRDSSQMFDTYHLNLLKTEKILQKFLVGTLVGGNELPVFQKRSEFYHTMKSRIEEYFKKTNQDPFFHWTMLVRYFLIFATLGLSYYLQFKVHSAVLSVLAAAIMGFACAQVGLLPLHDASHCAITKNPKVWLVLGALHDFVNGASHLNWSYQHVLGHHPYTNIANADPDITTNDPDVRRIKPSQKWFPNYINQEYFVPVLYGLLGTKVRLQDVNLLFIEKMNDSIRVNEPALIHQVIFWGGKAFFVVYRIIVPLMLMSWQQTALNFVVADLVSSYWLALTFQANHVVDDVEWPEPNEKNEVDMDWAKMQVVTAQDYAHKSLIWTQLAGALNYQVVHHIFPNICQHYYPEIAPIIMDTCKEYNVRYRVKDTYREAIQGHFDHLRKLGKEPIKEE